MNDAHASWMWPRRPTYAAGIGLSLLVHGLLLSLWQLAQPQRQEGGTPSSGMILRLLRTPRPEPALPAPAPRAAPAERAAPRERGEAQAAPQATSERVSGAETAPEQAGIDAAPPAEAGAAPAPSARELLGRARAAAGDIDRRLRRENPQRGIVAPVETAQMKLEKGIAQAAELVPNKWYQAPKVTEIMDPGGYDRRRYRVVGARGTYCVTYESNHGPDGRDSMRDGLPPKKTTCDEDEGPATSQKWNDAPAAPPRAPFRN